MNTKIYSIIAAAALVLGFTGCQDDTWKPQTDKTGSLRLGQLGVDVVDDEATSKAATVDVSTFTIDITNAEGAICATYQYSKLPEILTLPVGDYTVTAYSHKPAKAEWDNPYFIGSQTFSIANKAITTVETVVCKFSAIKVTVKFSDELKKFMSDDCKVKVVANDEGELTFTAATEGSVGYFEAIENSGTLVATFSGTIAGYPETYTKTYTNASAGTYYDITFGVKGGDSLMPEETGKVDPNEPSQGGISISITGLQTNDVVASGTFEEEVIGGLERPGKEDPIEPENPGNDPGTQDPGTTTDLFTFDSSTIDFNGENSTGGTEYKVTITSVNPLANLKVWIDSEVLPESDLNDIGLTEKFDLAYPGEYEEALAGFGFALKDQVIGQSTVEFDISDFIPLLTVLGPGTSRFHLTPVDNKGNQQTVTLTFVVK